VHVGQVDEQGDRERARREHEHRDRRRARPADHRADRHDDDPDRDHRLRVAVMAARRERPALGHRRHDTDVVEGRELGREEQAGTRQREHEQGGAEGRRHAAEP